MPTMTFAAALPLLAVLTFLAPPEAVAGPPERPSGQMVLDVVADGLLHYRRAPHPEARVRWLERLTPRSDPRVVAAVGEALLDASPEVAHAAARIVEDTYDPSIQDLSGEHFPYAVWWWLRHQADLRRRAKQLPQ